MSRFNLRGILGRAFPGNYDFMVIMPVTGMPLRVPSSSAPSPAAVTETPAQPQPTAADIARAIAANEEAQDQVWGDAALLSTPLQNLLPPEKDVTPAVIKPEQLRPFM